MSSDGGLAEGRGVRAEAHDVHEIQRGRPTGVDRYSLISLLAVVGQIPSLARLDAGVVIALDSSCCGQQRGPKTVNSSGDREGGSLAVRMGGTGSKREDHVLTVFVEQRQAQSSLLRSRRLLPKLRSLSTSSRMYLVIPF